MVCLPDLELLLMLLSLLIFLYANQPSAPSIIQWGREKPAQRETKPTVKEKNFLSGLRTSQWDAASEMKKLLQNYKPEHRDMFVGLMYDEKMA